MHYRVEMGLFEILRDGKVRSFLEDPTDILYIIHTCIKKYVTCTQH